MWDVLIIHPTRRDFVRPADNKRSAKRGLHRRKIRTTPRTTAAFRRVRRLRPVIAGENDHRTLFDIRFLDGVEYLARPKVHLGDAVGPIAIACLARKLRIWVCLHVNRRDETYAKYGSPALAFSLDECNGAVVISFSMARR